MDMVNFIIKMEVCMMVIGVKIKCRGMENYFINLVSLLMKVNGKMINLWVKVYYLMKSHKN